MVQRIATLPDPPVPSEEERHKRTLKALADVDAGRLADNEDVAARINSLGFDGELALPRPK